MMRIRNYYVKYEDINSKLFYKIDFFIMFKMKKNISFKIRVL